MKNLIRPSLLAVLVGIAIYMSATAVKGIAAPQESVYIPDELVYESIDAEYYLRDCDGLVAVFRGKSSSRPIETTDIETEALSDVDRELLKRGIPAQNKYELLCLLEDFSS